VTLAKARGFIPGDIFGVCVLQILSHAHAQPLAAAILKHVYFAVHLISSCSCLHLQNFAYNNVTRIVSGYISRFSPLRVPPFHHSCVQLWRFGHHSHVLEGKVIAIFSTRPALKAFSCCVRALVVLLVLYLIVCRVFFLCDSARIHWSISYSGASTITTTTLAASRSRFDRPLAHGASARARALASALPLSAPAPPATHEMN
jgi:hypothetical protein